MKRNRAILGESTNEKPNAKQRKICCDEFVRITKTDENLAISYLFDTKYDLKLALEMYNSEDHMVIDGYTLRCSQIKVKDLRVISWNIEGLEKTEMKKRLTLAILTILKSKANIVLLQELVEEYESEIRKYFQEDYDIFIDKEKCLEDYYCGILVRKHPNIKIISDSFQIENFENSVMGRNLLKLTVHINGIPVKIMTGHLESTKDFSQHRKDQLIKAFQEMQNDTDYSIFAGDLNLRDKEVVEIGNLPNNIVDVWEATGKRSQAKLTWDPKRNFNAGQNCPNAFGLRFDRMYFYSKNNSQNIKPIFFGLDGLEKISSGVRFASDHWAIVGHFKIE